MKIIRIIARLNVGGPARHVIWLTNALQNEEFQSILVTGSIPPGEEDMAYLAEAEGVQPVFVEEMSRELSVKDVISLIKIFRLILREKPDIIHTHTAKAGTLGRSAAFLYKWLTPAAIIGKPRKVSLVHTFHGHVFHSYYGKLKTSVFVAIEKLLARLATDKIVVISEKQFDEIHGRYGVGKREQFKIIPLGIDLEPFGAAASRRAEIRQEFAVEKSTLVVGFVGRLTEIKNIPLYLKVAEACEPTDDPAFPDLRFIVVGDGHLRPALEAEVAERHINKLVFLGNRRDVEAVYAGLDIVALTSLNEGTPLSLIEAMASRKPVISTMVGGVIDLLGIVKERHEGFCICDRGIGVQPNDSVAFLSGLIYLAKNERLREELASKGHEFVHGRYGKNRLIEDIKDLYRGF